MEISWNFQGRFHKDPLFSHSRDAFEIFPVIILPTFFIVNFFTMHHVSQAGPESMNQTLVNW